MTNVDIQVNNNDLDINQQSNNIEVGAASSSTQKSVDVSTSSAEIDIINSSQQIDVNIERSGVVNAYVDADVLFSLDGAGSNTGFKFNSTTGCIEFYIEGSLIESMCPNNGGNKPW